MSNPYAIDGPAVVSFSGGRSSAYLLHQVLTTGGGPCDEDGVHYLFANTGKEREETLAFVDRIEDELGVAIVWLEYRPDAPFAEVTFETASRHGEPFEALITKRRYLPTPATRMCTQELKIRPMKNWMRARGYERWTNVVGIRADEPRRIARMRGRDTSKERYDIALPLVDAGVTKADVLAFWRAQPFDLELDDNEGNCDLCFMKRLAVKVNIIRERPALATWWARQEERIGHAFRIDHPSYRDIAAQGDLFTGLVDEDLVECFCHD